MTGVLVFGGSGYSGLELLRLLASHRGVEVVAASSDRHAGRSIAEQVPGFARRATYVGHDALLAGISAGQLAFLATPAETSHALAPKLLAAGLSVIDLSGAFRLASPDDHREWYGFAHEHPELLERAVYGLPELFPVGPAAREPVLIANPGCYATCAALAVAPLASAGLVEEGAPIFLDGKSGTTGAGRKADEAFSFSEVAETVRPYRLARHQHTPEIERTLGRVAGRPVRVSFTAHLLPMRRGLLVSAYAQARPGVDQAAVDAAYAETYRNSPFVRVLGPDRPPHPGPVAHTNFCDVSAKLDARTGSILAFGALDNLVKGAAGQAIQNMNLLLGLPPTAGLLPGGAS